MVAREGLEPDCGCLLAQHTQTILNLTQQAHYMCDTLYVCTGVWDCMYKSAWDCNTITLAASPDCTPAPVAMITSCPRQGLSIWCSPTHASRNGMHGGAALWHCLLLWVLDQSMCVCVFFLCVCVRARARVHAQRERLLRLGQSNSFCCQGLAQPTQGTAQHTANTD